MGANSSSVVSPSSSTSVDVGNVGFVPHSGPTQFADTPKKYNISHKASLFRRLISRHPLLLVVALAFYVI